MFPLEIDVKGVTSSIIERNRDELVQHRVTLVERRTELPNDDSIWMEMLKDPQVLEELNKIGQGRSATEAQLITSASIDVGHKRQPSPNGSGGAAQKRMKICNAPTVAEGNLDIQYGDTVYEGVSTTERPCGNGNLQNRIDSSFSDEIFKLDESSVDLSIYLNKKGQ